MQNIFNYSFRPSAYILLFFFLVACVMCCSPVHGQGNSGKPKKTHFKPSKVKVLKKQKIEGATIELVKVGTTDTLVINTNENGQKKGQRIRLGKPTSLKLIYYNTQQDSATYIEVETGTLICDYLPPVEKKDEE